MSKVIEEWHQIVDVDTNEAKQFFELLRVDGGPITFQTIDDKRERKDRALTGILHGSLDQLSNELVELNRQSAGIFFAVNETDLKGRSEANVTRVRAVWQDDDNAYAGDYPLEPTIVVETSPGKCQRYWIVDDQWKADDEGRRDFRTVMQRMVKDYGADRQAIDLPRALRVPGYFHCKKEPFRSTIVGGCKKRYSREEILSAFPPPAIEIPKRALTSASLGNKLKLISSFEEQRIKDAAKYLNDLTDGAYFRDRETWLPVGMTLHHKTNGNDQGRHLWEELSREYSGDQFDSDELRKDWNSFKSASNNPATLSSFFWHAKSKGWNDGQQDEFEHPIEWMPKGGTLTEAATKGLRAEFEKFKHNPSDDHWKGLGEIARAIEHMANGTLEKKFYLSSLPPGLGKSTTLVQSVRALVASKEHSTKSVIVFLSRLEEIGKQVASMGLDRNEFSVLTSDDKFNKLGNQNKKGARVMFTTQQMLESRCKRYSRFSDMEDFFYSGALEEQGTPRDVRVWDEAIVPTMNMPLERYALMRLLSNISKVNNDVAVKIDSFAKTLEITSDNGLITVPELTSSGLSGDAAEKLFKDTEDKQLVRCLWALAGKTVRVRKDQYDRTALDYQDILPKDLAPLLILDASGQTKETYRLWFENRKGLAYLYSPPKNYTNLTIHWWDKGGGKSSYEKRNGSGKDQIDGITDTIKNDIPSGAKVLVVHGKPNHARGILDLEAEVRKRLEADEFYPPYDREIGFLTYGKHTATNEFADFSHVILAGIQTLPTSAIEAMARGAKNIEAEIILPKYEFDKTKLGEQMHDIFQAANRGLVRKSEGDDCPKGCHLYIIASKRTGVPDALTKIFPGAQVATWEPVKKRVGERIKKAGDYLVQQFGLSGPHVSKKDVRVHVDGKDTNASNFDKTVLNHANLVSYLSDLGYSYSYKSEQRGEVFLQRHKK